MFLWCANCQHLIGESAPLDCYSITHGICAACEPEAERFRPSSRILSARDVFCDLLQAGREGRFKDAAARLRRAVESGLTPTEIMLGVVQPALGEIGRLWESGDVTVADEHRFTAFCEEAAALLPAPPQPGPHAPGVLLLMSSGNDHALGVRMLSRVAVDAGVRCEVVYPGLPDDAALDICRRLRPDLVGVSASLTEHVSAADALARRVAQELGLKVVLGGGAFRRSSPAPKTTTPVLLTLDDFRKTVSELAAESGSCRDRSSPMC